MSSQHPSLESTLKSSKRINLVNFFNGRSTAWSSTAHVWHVWHVWHTSSTSSTLVHLGHDRVSNCFEALELLSKFFSGSSLISVQPLQSSINCIIDRLLILFSDLILDLLFRDRGSDTEAIILKFILLLNTFTVLFVFFSVLFSLLNHSVDLILRKTSLLSSN